VQCDTDTTARAVMIVWRIRRKIIRTVSAVLCMSVVHSYKHNTYEQFLQVYWLLETGCGLGLVKGFLCVYVTRASFSYFVFLVYFLLLVLSCQYHCK